MTQQEEWRPIPGFPDYLVSDQGRVRSTKKRNAPLVLRPGIASNGYFTVCLRQDSKPHTRTVHSLVTEAFHGPRPTAGYEVRHLNGQRLDCRAANLRWGSRVENAQDTLRLGTHYWVNRTECKNGHPWDEANTYQSPKQRVCKTCRRETKARYHTRRALRAAGIAA